MACRSTSATEETPQRTASPNRGTRLWLALAAVMGAAALLGFGAGRTRLDWQPALAWAEPWRAWTALAVHYSALHLAANLAGLLLVALFGWAARVPPRCAVAWCVALPLTHLALVLRPDLVHAGGLSGILHAGVAVVGLHLLVEARDRGRAVGAAVLVGLIAKVVTEAPWREALRFPAGWDIAVAPLLHATGFAAGLFCAITAEGWARTAGGIGSPLPTR